MRFFYIIPIIYLQKIVDILCAGTLGNIKLLPILKEELFMAKMTYVRTDVKKFRPTPRRNHQLLLKENERVPQSTVNGNYCQWTLKCFTPSTIASIK